MSTRQLVKTPRDAQFSSPDEFSLSTDGTPTSLSPRLHEASSTSKSKRDNAGSADNTKPQKKVLRYNSTAFMALVIVNVLFLGLIYAAVAIYEPTLERCTLSEPQCVRFIGKNAAMWTFKAWVAATIFDIILVLLFFNALSRPIVGVALFVALVYVYQVSDGWTLDLHGSFNKLVLIMCMVFNGIAIFWLGVAYKAMKKFGKLFSFIGIALVTYAIYFFKVNVYDVSCQTWANGLADSKLSELVGCKLPAMDFCYYDMVNNVFDFSSHSSQTCHNDFGELENTLPFYGEAKVLGFPATSHWSDNDRSNDNLQNNILKRMVKADTLEEIKDPQVEVIITRNGTQASAKVQVKVTRNETLVKLRKDMAATATNKPLVKNILTIFIDALPRAHFLRKLKKTTAWINKFYNNDESLMESYQFFRYHSVGYYTASTIFPIYFGTSIHERNGIEITKHLEEQGYITGESRDICLSKHFSYRDGEFPNITFDSPDHENIAMFCDPNYHQFPFPTGMFAGPYSLYRRCLYGKDTYEYVLEYGAEFWKAYADQPKFLELGFTDQHESTGEVVGYMDDKLAEFLGDMEQQGLLNDTAIVFYADHGQHMNLLLYLTNATSMRLEMWLPTLFIMLPRELADTHGKNLKDKEQTLVNSFDLHNFFKGVSGLTNYAGYGKDLLLHDIEENRTCENYYKECMCEAE